jgi:hypothetical protein
MRKYYLQALYRRFKGEILQGRRPAVSTNTRRRLRRPVTKALPAPHPMTGGPSIMPRLVALLEARDSAVQRPLKLFLAARRKLARRLARAWVNEDKPSLKLSGMKRMHKGLFPNLPTTVGGVVVV